MKITTRAEFNWDSSLKKYVEIYCESYEYDGEVALCKGGGTSGAVSHPDYIKSTYRILVEGTDATPATNLPIGMLDALITVLNATTPYANAAAYSPDPFISLDQEQLSKTEDALISNTPTIDTDRWDAMHEAAKSKAEALFIQDAIDKGVDAYAEKTVDEFNAGVNRYSQGMAEANAVHSSAFIIGMSLLETQRVRDINTHRTVLTIENEKAKTQYMQKAIGDMVNLMNMHMGNRLEILRWQTEIGRLGIIAKSEQFEKDIEYDREDALWDLTAIGKAANIMATPGGGLVLPEKPSRGASALSGALSGAATGAAVGGPIGAGIGGALGAVGGWFS